MPRLEGVCDRDASLGARIAFFFTKRKLEKMTGLKGLQSFGTAEMLEPLRMYAHIPRLLNAYGRLEQAESKLDVLSARHRALAELKSAARTCAAPEREVRNATINAAAGAVIFVAGRAAAIMGFTVRSGRIAAIDVLADPARIAKLDLSAVAV
jgi:hypothetical protein